MKATIKTGGKQYNVGLGDVISIEKIDAKAGDKVALTAICIIDGDKVEADPAKAAKTVVKAEVLEQFKGEKQIVFKFKRRKNYKVKRGHRQQLTKVRIVEIGSAKFDPKKVAKPAAKPAAKKEAPKAAEAKPAAKPAVKAEAKKPASKPAAKPAAKKTDTKKPAAKPAEKKAPAKKPAAKPAAKKAPAKKPADKK